MPVGRLREPLEALADADVVFTDAEALPTVTERAVAMGIPAHHVLSIAREPGAPRLVEPWGAAPVVPRGAPVVAVAGIAGPARFFDSLRAAGWNVVADVAFADHHWFTAGDVARLGAVARQHAAALILTTEKDMMRLLPRRPLPLPVAWVPLELSWPVVQVREIVAARLAAVRRARSPEPPWPVTTTPRVTS
jgi:tetraacyldisaccharide 4'-kinase